MKKSLFKMLAAVISGAVFLTSCASEGTADKYGLEQTNAGKTEILLSGSVEKKETKQNEGNSVNADTEKRYPDGTLTCSNLTGETVRNEVKEILSAAGISESRIEKVFEWIKDFNSCMGSCENFDLKDDFVSVSAYAIDYGDYYPMSTMWFKTNRRDYGDILCRLAAYELLKDFISVSNPLDESEWECYSDTQWLYSDYDAICNNPLVDFGESEMEKYFSLYSPIEIKTECSEQEMNESIIKAWGKRGISFEESKCSLITIDRKSVV